MDWQSVEARDLLRTIFSFVRRKDWLSVLRVCRYWNKIAEAVFDPVNLSASLLQDAIYGHWRVETFKRLILDKRVSQNTVAVPLVESACSSKRYDILLWFLAEYVRDPSQFPLRPSALLFQYKTIALVSLSTDSKLNLAQIFELFDQIASRQPSPTFLIHKLHFAHDYVTTMLSQLLSKSEKVDEGSLVLLQTILKLADEIPVEWYKNVLPNCAADGRKEPFKIIYDHAIKIDPTIQKSHLDKAFMAGIVRTAIINNEMSFAHWILSNYSIEPNVRLLQITCEYDRHAQIYPLLIQHYSWIKRSSIHDRARGIAITVKNEQLIALLNSPKNIFFLFTEAAK